MFVYRGERLKEEGYIKGKRAIDLQYMNEHAEYCQKQLEELRLEREKIIAQNSKAVQQYEIYTKPIKELTVEEKNSIIEDYVNMRASVKKKDFESVSDDMLDIIRTEIKILGEESPLVKISKDIDFFTRELKEKKDYFYKSFLIALNGDDINRENIDLILEKMKVAKQKGFEFMVGIDGDMSTKSNDDKVDYVYSKAQMELLLELDNALKNNGYSGVVFSEMRRIDKPEDFDRKWSLEQVVNANREIDGYANYILKNNLSPFEAMIYIHKMASQFVYRDGILENGRVLPSILNSTDIVCSGYASFVKAIVDRINLPGLTCDLKGCDIGNKGVMSGHCHNLIHIEDSKYEIKGTYMEDACWDSREEGRKKGRGLAHCLYPVGDVLHFAGGKTYSDEPSKTRLSNLIFDPISVAETLKKLDQNFFEKIIYRIGKLFKSKPPLELVNKYAGESAPIDIEKYKEALKEVLRTKYSDEVEIERIVNEDIENSINTSLENFTQTSQNVFVQEAQLRGIKIDDNKKIGPKARL